MLISEPEVASGEDFDDYEMLSLSVSSLKNVSIMLQAIGLSELVEKVDSVSEEVSVELMKQNPLFLVMD